MFNPIYLYIPTNNKVRVYFLTHVKYIQRQVTVVRPNTLKFCNLRYRQTATLFLKKKTTIYPEFFFMRLSILRKKNKYISSCIYSFAQILD